MYRRIEKSVSIHSVKNCPVQLLDCALLHDSKGGGYTLELNLQNNSGKILAEVTLELTGFDRDNRQTAGERMVYRVVGTPKSSYQVQPYRELSLPVEKINRFSVSLCRVLAYRQGNSGEVENLLRN